MKAIPRGDDLYVFLYVWDGRQEHWPQVLDYSIERTLCVL